MRVSRPLQIPFVLAMCLIGADARAETALFKTVSMLTAHRPYQGAASLKGEDGIGFEFGVEALMMRLPDDLMQGLGGESSEESSGGSSLGFLPSARAHIAWGISRNVDVSTSGLWYLGSFFAGGALKVKVFEPMEGPAFAVRGHYNFTRIDSASLPIQLPSATESATTALGDATATVSPNIVLETMAFGFHAVVSKRMTWAEPYAYLGIDGGTAISILTATTTVEVEGVGSTTQVNTVATAREWYYGAVAGGGVIFRVPLIGLKIALEGAYSSMGMPTLGAQVGVSF